MTTNRPLEDWGKLLGDVPTATAILDRFLHHAEIITIEGGRSYRLKDRHREQSGESSSNQATEPKAPSGSPEIEKDSKPAKAPTGSTAETKTDETQKN
jgi:hypothetical protein